MSDKIVSKSQIAKEVGSPLTTISDWLRDFYAYVPNIKQENKIKYTENSIEIVKIIKLLKDNGLNKNTIVDLFKSQGVPKGIKEKEKFITYARKYFQSRIPASNQIIKPFLEILSDGKIYQTEEIKDKLGEYFSLTQEQLEEMNNKSTEARFAVNIRWAKYDLKKKNMIEVVGNGLYRITDEGRRFLSSNPEQVEEESEIEHIDPIDVVREQAEQIKRDLSEEILKQVQKAHWTKLENIVVELLVAMGYGTGEITKRTNDEGIDGIINEDKLGLDRIYVQAKRYSDDKIVGREAVMSFSGALDGKGARKGVFITTSRFSKSAEEYADRLETKKIILINGEKLANYMIEYGIGVSVKERIEIKRIDMGYFLGDE